MAPIGKLETFDESTENIESYNLHVEAYFVFNQVQEAIKVNALIAVLGSKITDAFCSLCAPDTPATVRHTHS
jgi:hypothetical protein